MRKNSLLTILTIIILICATSCGKIAEPTVLIMADVQTDTHPTALACDKFAELVKEETNGRIIVEVYHGNTLGNEQSQVEQATIGGIDLVRASISAICKYDATLEALQALYIFDDDEHLWHVLNGSMGNEFLNSPILAEHNLVGLSWFSGSSRNFYNTVKPITSPADLSGLTIRVNTPAMTAFLELLGAIPKDVAYTDIYSSLEAGHLEGAENNWPSYISTEHYTLAPYITIDEHTKVPEMIIASKSSLEKLSPNDQEILKICAAKAQDYQIEQMLIFENSAIKTAEEYGCTITRLTDQQLKLFQDAGEITNMEINAPYMDIINQIKANKPT